MAGAILLGFVRDRVLEAGESIAGKKSRNTARSRL